MSLKKHLTERSELLYDRNPHDHEWDDPCDDIEHSLLGDIDSYLFDDDCLRAYKPTPEQIIIRLESVIKNLKTKIPTKEQI